MSWLDGVLVGLLCIYSLLVIGGIKANRRLREQVAMLQAALTGCEKSLDDEIERRERHERLHDLRD